MIVPLYEKVRALPFTPSLEAKINRLDRNSPSLWLHLPFTFGDRGRRRRVDPAGPDLEHRLWYVGAPSAMARGDHDNRATVGRGLAATQFIRYRYYVHTVKRFRPWPGQHGRPF
jgi:hypothetical protein